MDIAKELKNLKSDPEFLEKVGMVLIHNGIARSSSRNSNGQVNQLHVKVDFDLLEQIRKEEESSPGIFKIIVKAQEGTFKPGDDLLYLIVAGDIRENVIPVLSRTLDRIKSQVLKKQEVFSS